MLNKLKVSLIAVLIISASCARNDRPDELNTSDKTMKILFLHHSTGQNVWNGGKVSFYARVVRKVCRTLGIKNVQKSYLQKLIARRNRQSGSVIAVENQVFPKTAPYGWHNYPFDYYNIWVKNGGALAYQEEPTLEMLTKDYQVIILKHCFPVSNIQADQDSADINSDYKSLSNYKLQYQALRDKMHQFPGTKFIVWTGAAQVKSKITEEEANRAREFFNWVIGEWDVPGDNIFIWDFYNLQTEGGLYFSEKFAISPDDSHPNKDFSRYAANLLCNRLFDVIENDGLKTALIGENIK